MDAMHVEWSRRIGFCEIHEVSGRYSVADLLPQSRGRCGLYLLGFGDGNYYIGKSIDAAKRFGQHRLNRPDIHFFGFQKVPKWNLDQKEEEVIWNAEKLGIPLTNKVFVSRTSGESDLDVLLTPVDQERWLNKPTSFRNERKRVHIENEEGHRRRFIKNFEKFCDDPDYRNTLPLLRRYIQETIPAFRRTEYSFWSLSCAPSTGRRSAPRIFTFNIANMETFVVGLDRSDPNLYWGFVNLSNDKMFEEYGSTWMNDFQNVLGGIEAEVSDYHTAGRDQARIWFSSLETCWDLLSNPGLLNAARLFNLNAMRRRSCLYAGYHCFQLVDAVLKRGS